MQLTNLLPYWILQPWVDAAFKKRGIDPENFWRSAGLPAFRFPDPNGTRFPNGAPPPAPPALEGTPDHPDPAVAPGSPCSYTPTPELLPRPGNPMPCAGIDQNLGPFGPNGPYPALPDVASSPPNPAGLPPTPGIPIAGLPGQVQPDVPGTPVPIAPGTARGPDRAAGTATRPGSGESRRGTTARTGATRTPGAAGARQQPAGAVYRQHRWSRRQRCARR